MPRAYSGGRPDEPPAPAAVFTSPGMRDVAYSDLSSGSTDAGRHLDGALVPGKESKLILTVTRAGEPVTDLQPYLAAYGHLVAAR